jgi:hypothetical protein
MEKSFLEFPETWVDLGASDEDSARDLVFK